MTVPVTTNSYAVAVGTASNNVSVPHYDTRAPAATDVNYPVGKIWVNSASNTAYILTSLSSSNGVVSANWVALASATGSLSTLTTDDTTVVTPTSGNINVFGGSGQLATTGSGSTVTLSIANPSTAPGAFTVTGLLTGLASATINTAGATLSLATDNSGDAVNIARGTVARTVGIANSAAAHVVQVGSTTGAASLTLQSGSGDITCSGGNLKVNTAAKQLQVHGGAATDFIGSVNLTSGTVTVLNTNIAATDRVFVARSAVNASTALGVFKVVVTGATNFVITACKPADGTTETGDASTVSYFIVRQL